MNLKLDEYAHLDSVIHRWEPRSKLVALVVLIFAFAFVESHVLLLPMGVVTIGLYALSGLPLSFLKTRLRYPGIFLLGIVLLLPWLSGDTVLWQWGWLTLRQEGLLTTLLITCRFVCIITVALVLVGSMPFITTIKTMRSLGLPDTLADMMLLSYRYLFEIASNLTTMRRSMRLRGFGQGARYTQRQQRLWFLPDQRDLSLLASLTGTLFIRSYEQSERVYKAMRMRGYGNPNLPPRPTLPTTRPAPQKPYLTHPWNAIALTTTLLIATTILLTELWL